MLKYTINVSEIREKENPKQQNDEKIKSKGNWERELK